MTKELEVRFEINEDLYKKFANELKKKSKSSESFQEDVYFCDKKYVDEKQTKNCPYIIRLRKSKSGNKVAYKSFLPDKTWIELESDVGNPDSMGEILEKIGQISYLNIKKKRISGVVDGFEINADYIEELGYFVELEHLTDKNTPHQYKVFENIIPKMGLQNMPIIEKGYVQLMEEKLAK